jgi:UDP-N-acetylglucosamine--dolichyl-phosphate N-acetylglucosaminephosphotransferase
MEWILAIPLIISFFVCVFFTPVWIRKAKEVGLIWEDMHKVGHPKDVAGSGGMIVLMSFIFGILVYIAIETFVLKTNLVTIKIFALLTTVLIAGLIGFVDDIFGWARGGLSARFRIILLIFASIPLVVIQAGEPAMMGIKLGLIYPLLIIPLGVVGAAATFNFIAGYNGLETRQGILITSALGIVMIRQGEGWLGLICFILVACLIAFYFYNKFPAKVFPGDILTYSVGALIAVIAIIGNSEKIAVFFFIPYIIEVILKCRGGLKKASFAKLNSTGGLEVPYEKFYGIEHIAIAIMKKIKKDKDVKESEVIFVINLFQLLIILVGFALFGGIF